MAVSQGSRQSCEKHNTCDSILWLALSYHRRGVYFSEEPHVDRLHLLLLAEERQGALLIGFVPWHLFLLVEPLPTGRSSSGNTTIARSWTTVLVQREYGPSGCSYLEVLWLVGQHPPAVLPFGEPPGKVSFRHHPSRPPGPWAPDRTVQPVLITATVLFFS